jgi:hypothetical protein
LTAIHGIGPKLLKRLNACNIQLGGLLYIPRKYIDYTQLKPSPLGVWDVVTIIGSIDPITPEKLRMVKTASPKVLFMMVQPTASLCFNRGL